MNSSKAMMTRGGWLASAVACILLILVLVPFAPELPIAGVDGSWAFAMNVATAEHLRFGQDVIFTFGPWASVYTEVYHPATDGLMLGGTLLIAVAMFAGLFAITLPQRRWLLPLFPLLVGLTWLPDWDGWRDAVFMLLPLLLPLAAVRGRETGDVPTFAIVLLAVAIGILPLVKGSLSVPAALASLVAVLLCWRPYPRMAFAIVGVEVAALVIAWSIAGQAVPDLPRYFLAQLPLITGYTDGMSVSVDGRPLNVVIYLLAGALLVAISALGGIRKRWYAPVLVALYLFVIFKASFVRHDPPHALIASSALLLIGFLLYLAPGSHQGRGAVAAVVGLLGHCLLAFAFLPLDPLASLARLGVALQLPAQGAWQRVASPKLLPERYQQRLILLGSRPPFAGQNGDMDLYPWDLSPLLASAAQWKPRPVVQSYAAFLPSLIDANAAHLERSPPSSIYFNINPIDQRYPALEDGASWLVLLGKYRPRQIDAGYAVLARRDNAATALQPGPSRSVDARLGKEFAVAGQEGPVWATLDVRPTLLGRLFGLVYKAPELTLEVRYENGESASYRLIAGMAKTGFLLSPTVTDLNEFVALGSHHREALLGGRKVVSMSVRGASGTRLMWKGDYKVTLAPLSIPADAGVDEVLAGPWQDSSDLASHPQGGNCNIESVDQAKVGGAALELGGQLVKIRGWAALDGAKGRANQGVSLLANGRDGRTWTMPVHRISRPDVANYFKKPELTYAGFEGFVDVRGLPEHAQIRVLQEDDGQQRVCSALLTIHRADALTRDPP